jgi:hypothetical protein
LLEQLAAHPPHGMHDTPPDYRASAIVSTAPIVQDSAWSRFNHPLGPRSVGVSQYPSIPASQPLLASTTTGPSTRPSSPPIHRLPSALPRACTHLFPPCTCTCKSTPYLLYTNSPDPAPRSRPCTHAHAYSPSLPCRAVSLPHSRLPRLYRNTPVSV